MNKIIKVLEDIKKNTAIDISLYVDSKLYQFCSDCSETVDENLTTTNTTIEVNLPLKNQFKNFVYRDLDNNKTFFLFYKNSKTCIGMIIGTQEYHLNYAKIILDLIDVIIKNSLPPIDENEKFRLLFKGNLPQFQYEILKSSYQDREFNFYVYSIMVKSKNKIDMLLDLLSNVASKEDILLKLDDKTIIYARKADQLGEYSSANNFAHVLYGNINEEMRIEFKINIGGHVNNFDELLGAYQNSLFAYNFGQMFDSSSDIYSYKEYVVIKMLSDIPKDTLNAHLNTLLDGTSNEILKDEELMLTAENFLKNSLNISETSRSLFVHRNTLIYRLDKIENATGLNIRFFNDAMIFRIITILSKFTSN